MADEMLDVERQVDADGNVYYVNAMAIHDARGRSFLAQLLVLRILCEKGRASSRGAVLARLFPCESERRAPLRIHSRYARAALPKELFWYIVQFWRSDRDI
ncbi:hypothetical protein JL720_14024 [Aureococcus anophagefferens]|nr:hypothetical protein JL720_14024 [Aureococcus anophagefferens]